MQQVLKDTVLKYFKNPVNTPKDCKLLAIEISTITKRNISESTLRRFFGLLPSNSSLSKYNLDTLAIYCGANDYSNFTTNTQPQNNIEIDKNKLNNSIKQITIFTLKGIKKSSLSPFENTIPRNGINQKLNDFIDSKFILYPVFAPGGFGKSTALAHFISQPIKPENECLFCSANILYQLITNTSNALNQLSFKIGSLNNPFDIYAEHFENQNKKFILVIDAFDEIIAYPNKLNEIICFIDNTLNLYSKYNFLKIVIVARDITWYNYLSKEFTTHKNAIFEPTLSGSIHSNIPTLTDQEVFKILDNHNDTESISIINNCISWYLKEMLRIPINLHLFVSLKNKNIDFENITRASLYHEYLNRVIFDSQYAEQKEEVLWAIIKLLQDSSNELFIAKSSVTNSYPIHLKRETAYYKAYEQLMMDGILSQERVKNKFGIYSTIIRFKHLEFYYYLNALNLIRLNNGLSFDLFHDIAYSNNNIEWKIFTISILYENAYQHEELASLENFCSLPNEILASLPMRLSVGQSFRIKNGIRNKLIEIFSSTTNGQTYFFEQFVDINYMFNNYELRIKTYLSKKKTNEAILFGNNILFLAGFYDLNKIGCEEHYEKLINIDIDSNIHPWPIGRKLASEILYNYFIKSTNQTISDGIIENYRQIAYSYPGYLENGLVEFELPVMIALSLTNNFQLLHEILTKAKDAYSSIYDNKNSGLIFANQNSLPKVFLEYAIFKLNSNPSKSLEQELISSSNKYYSTMDDFQYRIIIQWFLCDYYLSTNKIKKAAEHWTNAFELSKYANYNFFIAYLLVNDPLQSEENLQLGNKMIEKSGFNKSYFRAIN